MFATNGDRTNLFTLQNKKFKFKFAYVFVDDDGIATKPKKIEDAGGAKEFWLETELSVCFLIRLCKTTARKNAIRKPRNSKQQRFLWGAVTYSFQIRNRTSPEPFFVVRLLSREFAADFGGP